ncbi:class I SAM-dependent DNA methyltransferase [Nesterenkonia xinjiangensis]|uniref:SAM-dependent methyltransferase n=1 Tax=Nesterenkonia xinjiangensis TaxID=225327 RepID=A0A7Z0GMN6_9MICC|nr:class I SAM-dependent methyltransferase [Nesterenkonia xinjiangensis]NYJ77986.1 SAM-dependent methyltransferase [Nesterenkonia xinjiangensis]
MTVQDTGYAEQFEGWYDRVFRKDESAEVLAEFLAGQHPDPASGTLELGVGTGRIAVPLARRVGQVVGVDSSSLMLDALQEECGEDLVVPRYGDMRTYTDHRRFGLIYIVCSALSLVLSREEQQQAVQRAADLLIPGGRLVLEAHNRPGCVGLHEGKTRTTLFFPYPERNTGLQTHATLLPDDLWHCSQIWFEADGTHRIGTEVLRLITPEDTDAYAHLAGLEPDGSWSDPLRSPYAEQSLMFIATYRKPS